METDYTKKITMAVAGDKGSFSEQAGRDYAQIADINNFEIIHATDMEGVLEKIENGSADLGIFPVYNTLGGLVDQAFTAMGKHRFSLVGQIKFPIHHCLMVLGNLKQNEIQEIISHQQPFRQCKEYLQNNFPNVPLREYVDMAKAAHDLSKNILSETSAVIGSSNTALIYGLTALEENIEDGKEGENVTTFIVVQKYEHKE